MPRDIAEASSNLARYDGTEGEVLRVETEEETKDGYPKVLVKLPDLVRELPIRCPPECVSKQSKADDCKAEEQGAAGPGGAGQKHQLLRMDLALW